MHGRLECEMRDFKCIVVTGGAGFIGANFIRYLLDDAGFSGVVVNFDALTYAGNPGSLADVASRFPGRYFFEKGDIRDPAAIGRVLDKYSADAICHFAAESHVDRSIAAPDDFVQTNIVGTFNLLEETRKRADRISLLHHVSTDEVFGSLGDDGFFSESTPYSPHSPYSASKAASDHLVKAYHDTYGVPVTITNCSNNYGPYQFPEKLIPLMIMNALEGKQLPVYGDGKNVRDWLYVVDHCSAIWRVMRAGKSGRTYCVGGRCELSNVEVVHRICSMMDKLAPPLPGGHPRDSLITFVKDRPGHDRRYAIDCSRIENELGWRRTETADTGFEKTLRWYLKNTEWVDSVRTGEYKNWIEKNYVDR